VTIELAGFRVTERSTTDEVVDAFGRWCSVDPLLYPAGRVRSSARRAVSQAGTSRGIVIGVQMPLDASAPLLAVDLRGVVVWLPGTIVWLREKAAL